MKKTLNNSLKSMRFNKGNITQADLADKLDVSRQTIIAIEKGKFNPSVKLALSMAEFFECRVEDIFNLTREEKT
jgi:putative transcriptional regulator